MDTTLECDGNGCEAILNNVLRNCNLGISTSLIQQFDAAFVMAAAPLVYGGTVVMPHLYQHHKVSYKACYTDSACRMAELLELLYLTYRYQQHCYHGNQHQRLYDNQHHWHNRNKLSNHHDNHIFCY